MKILALDLATRTGWAFWDGQRLESGVQDFSKQRGESNGMLFVKFNRWLNEFGLLATITDMKLPDLVVYEQTFAAFGRGGGGFITEISIGLITRVQEFCAIQKIEHSAVHNATLKKWATGNGRASKADMVCAAIERKKAEVYDDNEADAILLACHAMEKFGK